MKDGRKEDYQSLQQQLSITRDPKERLIIMRAMETIKKERHNPAVQSMRESLLRETRAGRIANARDIRDEVFKRSKYQSR